MRAWLAVSNRNSGGVKLSFDTVSEREACLKWLIDRSLHITALDHMTSQSDNGVLPACLVTIALSIGRHRGLLSCSCTSRLSSLQKHLGLDVQFSFLVCIMFE